jgi:hypothetical protein
MVPGPGVRFLLLRRFTIALTATSFAFAAILYLQVSGALGGIAGSLFGGAQAATDATTQGPSAPGGQPAQGVQPPTDNPAPGNGPAVAQTGGS